MTFLASTCLKEKLENFKIFSAGYSIKHEADMTMALSNRLKVFSLLTRLNEDDLSMKLKLTSPPSL